MRKYFLDNLRYSIVLLVIFFHAIYIFNSVGVITNLAIPGIPEFDIVLYILYPWFMPCMFLIAGVSAKYALDKISNKEFLKARLKKIFIPSIAGIFIIGWIGGLITNQYADIFGGNGAMIPGIVKYLIYCLCGIGVLWFLHELMLASVVLVIIRKFDKNDRLHKLGGKTNIFVILLLSLVVWGSANILNTPLIEVYRNGIYIFMFLLGYYIFSHDHIQELLAKWTLPLLGIATVLCVLFCVKYWGQNYSAMPILKGFLTNMYAWFGTLAVFAFANKYMDKETSFTRFMRGNSFGYYVLHYPLMISAACLIDHYFDIPAILFYVLIIVCEIVLLPIITEVIKRIPVIRALLLGLSR